MLVYPAEREPEQLEYLRRKLSDGLHLCILPVASALCIARCDRSAVRLGRYSSFLENHNLLVFQLARSELELM